MKEYCESNEVKAIQSREGGIGYACDSIINKPSLAEGPPKRPKSHSKLIDLCSPNREADKAVLDKLKFDATLMNKHMGYCSKCRAILASGIVKMIGKDALAKMSKGDLANHYYYLLRVCQRVDDSYHWKSFYPGQSAVQENKWQRGQYGPGYCPNCPDRILSVKAGYQWNEYTTGSAPAHGHLVHSFGLKLSVCDLNSTA